MWQKRVLALLLCFSLCIGPCVAAVPPEGDSPILLTGPTSATTLGIGLPALVALCLSPELRTFREMLETGLPGTRRTYPSYQDAMDAVCSRYSALTVYTHQQMEGNGCTVLLTGWGPLPHGLVSFLDVVYQDGSYLGEGVQVSLPLPRTGVMGGPRIPDSLEISCDGKFLSYSYHLSQPVALALSPLSVTVFQEAGVYLYTTHLTSGITWLKFSPLENEDGPSV